jgi:meso-butanediol dehydrogenase/(S,S)-butanediol dehydrogenase/diacetyl reductase
MVNALSHELATRNVRINVISPGYLATDMWFKDILGGSGTSPQEAPTQFDALVASAVPLGRPQTPQDIGDAAVYLASAPNVTGAEIIVDGGRVAGP